MFPPSLPGSPLSGVLADDFLQNLESSSLLLPALSIDIYLENHLQEDDEAREGEVDEEPQLHRLDVRGGGEAGGHREVDRGQDHHAGDVHGDDQAVLVLGGDVASGLVDHVHQNRGQVGHHENAKRGLQSETKPMRSGPHESVAI